MSQKLPDPENMTGGAENAGPENAGPENTSGLLKQQTYHCQGSKER